MQTSLSTDRQENENSKFKMNFQLLILHFKLDFEF